MIDFIPPSILVPIGPFPIHFYGLAYAIGLAATYWVMSHEARRRGHDPELLANGLIVVAIAAIIGGRAYHVIDQIASTRTTSPRRSCPSTRPATSSASAGSACTAGS